MLNILITVIHVPVFANLGIAGAVRRRPACAGVRRRPPRQKEQKKTIIFD